MAVPPQNFDILRAAQHFGCQVQGKPLDRKLGKHATVEPIPQGLSYYTEEMAAQFSREGMVALALQVANEMEEIEEVTNKLIFLFKEEFVPLEFQFDIKDKVRIFEE